MAKTRVEIEGTETLKRKLEQLPIELRGGVLRTSLREAGNLVKQRMRELVPQPGSKDYTKRAGKRKDRKHLRDTIAVTIKDYSTVAFTGQLLVIRPEWPAGNARHLVEHGHRLKPNRNQKTYRASGRLTTPKTFIADSFTDTESRARSIIVDGVSKAVAKWLLSNAMR